MIEEVIELVAYAITLAAAVWQVFRPRRLTDASSPFSLTALARGLQGRSNQSILTAGWMMTFRL